MKRHMWIMPVALAAAVCFGPAPAARADETGVPQRLAGLYTVDTANLSGMSNTISAVPSFSSSVPAAALVMQAHARALRPAPLPDQDLDAPGPNAQALAAQDETSVQPSFYSTSKHFSGDGFAAGSTLEDDHVNRRRPGGGMSLSIPVQ